MTEPYKTLVLRVVLCVFVLMGTAVSSVFAQSSIPGLGTLESIIGPIFPACGIASTFRSEVGTGLSVMALNRAQLSGNNLRTPFSIPSVALQDYANLDTSPLRYDAYVKVRLWRFGSRVQWTQFQDKSLSPDLGRYSFAGLVLGSDFDVIQHCWLVLGVRADWYLGEPSFQGVIRQPLLPLINRLSVDLTGKRPSTIGVYARYVPPEIINIPVHAEIYYDTPLQGSALKCYGISLVFRPQIYRFDIAAKVIVEKNYLTVQDSTNAVNPYKLETEWSRYGAEAVIYF
ncbi:MAG TPA: hypothetical protein VK463_12140 [Desulfomonilaceae bacterium]|nr:hypothetical protein [Desulfomonilaceae bacterium]